MDDSLSETLGNKKKSKLTFKVTLFSLLKFYVMDQPEIYCTTMKYTEVESYVGMQASVEIY